MFHGSAAVERGGVNLSRRNITFQVGDECNLPESGPGNVAKGELAFDGDGARTVPPRDGITESSPPMMYAT